MSDIVSAPRMVVTQFVRHHLPIGTDVNLTKEQLDCLVVQVRGRASGKLGWLAPWV
jgi:hypothetical protein